MKRLCTWLLTTTCFLNSGISSAFAAKKMQSPTSCLKQRWSQKRFSHRIYSRLLKRYVRNGRVNYQGLKRQRHKLDLYLCRLAHTDIKKIRQRRARLAFWINAYNAVTLRAVLDRLPASRDAQRRFSVASQKPSFWRAFAYKVAKQWLTLDQIENQIIRPRFREPRIHFALVCAARGCPHLASKAYTSSRLDRMLNQNTRNYLRSPAGCKLNRATKTIHLSKLFQWYAKDFVTKQTPHRLLFVAKYLPKSDQKYLRQHYRTLQIKWIPYDWKLNVQ